MERTARESGSESVGETGRVGGRIAVGSDAGGNPNTNLTVLNSRRWNICGIFCDGFEG